MKIQTKTAILFTVLTSIVFCVLVFIVYYFSNKFVYNDFYKRLELRARIAAKFQFERDHNTTESFKQIQKQYLERLPEEETYTVKLTPDNKPVPPVPAGLPNSYLQEINRADGQTVFHQDGFVHFAGLLYQDETGNFLVIESAENKYGEEIITRLGNILILTLLVSVIIIFSAGIYFARKTFQPVRSITARVQAISEGNLHVRLEEVKGTDEIAQLILTFNIMLDRLSAAFETQNNFISHASHELRTPLTGIVAEADYALSRERTTAEYQASLKQIVQQAEKLQTLTKGLLSLAQTGFDGKKQQWGLVRIDELLYAVKENIDAILPNNQLTISLPVLPENEEDISIKGNAGLLKIALDNIVLNACKYSGNQRVIMELNIVNRTALITIIDKGIGIPPTEMAFIFDPFFRASNTSNFEGYGVGLPLSQNILHMHRGKIILKSEVEHGTIVTVTLPLA